MQADGNVMTILTATIMPAARMMRQCERIANECSHFDKPGVE